jgi:DNA polymerase-3 subunit beta
MKITILKSYLNESIQHVAKAISNRTTIPILTGVKIDARSSGVTLTGSDTDISIQSFIPLEDNGLEVINIERAGSVVLPSKFFIEIIKKLPSETIEIEVKDHFQTSIRSGNSDIQMVGLDPEEYPLLPNIDQTVSISILSDILKTMIRQTTFAVSTSEATSVLTGVLWSMKEDSLKLIACDRHRLATRETKMQLDSITQNQVVISGRTLNELSKILPDQNILINIITSDNQVLFKLGRVLFYSRILDGTYPDTSRLIPQTFQTQLIVNTKELTNAVDRANLLSREEKTNIVKLTVKEDQTVEISSSSSELGKVTETIASKSLSGELLRISFNSKFMLDALKVIDSEDVHLGFTGPMSPIIIRPEDGPSLLQLILPYRTTN